MTYYGWKRFRTGRGVTQPSQIRYVYYFEQVYKRIIRSPMLKSPEKIVIHTIPLVSKRGNCRPFVEILNGVDFSTVNSSWLISNYRYGVTKEARI